MSDKHTINARAQKLLMTLVERYIREGQPVGSKTLAADSGIVLSSATIRHIMADLEQAGFLRSPHTSAGRVPTKQAYRFFVDSLLSVKSFSDGDMQSYAEQLNDNVDIKSLVASASEMLSSITHCAGIVTLPRREKLKLRHVEFLPLSENRILVILVLNRDEVQNRVIHTDRPYSPSELQQAANYLMAHYAGRDLSLVRRSLLKAMRQDRSDMKKLSQLIVKMADEAFAQDASGDCVVAGETNLLDIADQAGLDRIRALFKAFSEKRDLLHLLDKCLSAEGIQIYIGEESGYAPLDLCSMVAAPYQVDGQIMGVLGVIGPTRMDYDHVIATVDMTARLMSAALVDDDT